MTNTLIDQSRGSASSAVEVRQVQNFYSSSALHPEGIVATTVFARRRFATIQVDPMIAQYFRSGSQERLDSRKQVAKGIKSFDAILAVLEWSLKGDITDAYAAAVDLLAECDLTLATWLDYFRSEYSTRGTNQIDLDAKLDVLISGLARAHRILPQARFVSITSQLTRIQSRVVKAAIINAAVVLAEEKGIEQPIIVLLKWFSFAGESDEYIQQYAREALEEIGLSD